jgi:hypothetical protein
VFHYRFFITGMTNMISMGIVTRKILVKNNPVRV